MPKKPRTSSGSKAGGKQASVSKPAAAAKRAGDGAAAKSSTEVIAEQMPGWKLAPQTKLRSPGLFHEGDMKIETGPSIAQLRRKFLGGEADSDAVDESSMFAAVNRRVQTVQIEPKSGGPAKTADIRGGKITIVQG